MMRSNYLTLWILIGIGASQIVLGVTRKDIWNEIYWMKNEIGVQKDIIHNQNLQIYTLLKEREERREQQEEHTANVN